MTGSFMLGFLSGARRASDSSSSFCSIDESSRSTEPAPLMEEYWQCKTHARCPERDGGDGCFQERVKRKEKQRHGHEGSDQNAASNDRGVTFRARHHDAADGIKEQHIICRAEEGEGNCYDNQQGIQGEAHDGRQEN